MYDRSRVHVVQIVLACAVQILISLGDCVHGPVERALVESYAFLVIGSCHRISHRVLGKELVKIFSRNLACSSLTLSHDGLLHADLVQLSPRSSRDFLQARHFLRVPRELLERSLQGIMCTSSFTGFRSSC